MAIIDVQCDECGEEFCVDEHGHDNGWFICKECNRKAELESWSYVDMIDDQARIITTEGL